MLGVLYYKHHYITKRICELLISNSRFLIQNLLKQLFCCTDIKESCFFVAKIRKILGLNNLHRPNGLATVFFHALIDFKIKKEYLEDQVWGTLL